MRILIATCEATPLARTGGLGDVCGALPKALSALGHDVSVIMPAHRSALASGLPMQPTSCEFAVPIGNKSVRGRILETRLPGTNVPVYLVDQKDYFDRPAIYVDTDGQEYKDNCERFAFFSRATLEAVRLMELRPDVLHLNDWTTGLIAAYLKAELRGVPPYDSIATLFTIHNLAYQGTFWHWDMLLTGLDWKYFNWRQMESFGNLNLLKTGLVFADAINTVSPTYALEIQQPELGCGLQDLLSFRRDVLSGIINGVDYSEWNPATDTHLAAHYDASNVVEGKAACKAALQRELGLTVRPEVPLIGLVGRLVEQKGIDLVTAVMEHWADHVDVQWAILGTGERRYEEQLTALAERFPRQMAVRIGFSDPQAHRIEAAADMFLMPSRYEPCGLSQLYSLKYGTVPVVRATGGLVDTITDATPSTLADKTATGFCFADYTSTALAAAMERACQAFAQPQVWRQLVSTGMSQDWSWAASAKEYVATYQRTIARRREPARAL